MNGTVLVTAIGSFSAEAVIETYKKAGYRVLGCDIYPAEWLATSLAVDSFFQAPYATEADRYAEFLEHVCRENQVDCLVPLTDAEIDVINEVRDRLQRLGVTVCISDEQTIRLCRDKKALQEYLEPLGICRTIPGELLEDVILREAASGYERLEYPLVIKPCHGRSSQGLRMIENAAQMRGVVEGLRDAAQVRGAAERLKDTAQMRGAVEGLRGAAQVRGAVEKSRDAAQMRKPVGEPESAVASCLVQPKIKGAIITVDVVRNSRTGQAVSLPRRELLRTPNGAGTSVYIYRNKELQDQCAAIAEALNIHGCVNFEFIESSEGEWYFLECNPRFSGGVAFSQKAGYDMVGNHLRCFDGGEIEPLREVKNQYLVKRYVEYCTKVEE